MDLESDEIDRRMARLRDRWPAPSVVDRVMAKLDEPSATIRPRRATRRLVLAVAASTLFLAGTAAWVALFFSPKTLQAAVQEGLSRAASAHLTITTFMDQGNVARSEVWYRRGQGLRAEAPDQILADDGSFQWSWNPTAPAEQQIILRQPSSGYFVGEITKMLALGNLPSGWTQERAAELDANVDGKACQAYVIRPPAVDPEIPPGAKLVDPRPIRAVALAEPGGLVRQVAMQRQENSEWRKTREIAIAYDAPVLPEQVAARLPANVRIVDRDKIFDERYPLGQAIHRLERGGLILAVHDVQPLLDREGFFVVSSVRGTPEHLRQFPPHRRRLNPEISVVEVASQPGANMMWDSKYDRIVLANAQYEGVDFSWWLIVPRRFFRLENGQKVYEPENPLPDPLGGPGRLDDLAGKAHLPLSATYLDPGHRNERGVPTSVSCWVEVDLPANRPPTTVDDVAARTRRDLAIMKHGGTYSLMGVAATGNPQGQELRPLSQFDPTATTDADYAAAVKRGIDDLRSFDQLGDAVLGGEGMQGGPPAR